MGEHTKGPWEARRHTGGPAVAIVALGEGLPVTVCDMPTWTGAARAQNTANARLIASAPDLLEAARLALPIMEQEFPAHGAREPESRAIAALRAAITRATSETTP